MAVFNGTSGKDSLVALTGTGTVSFNFRLVGATLSWPVDAGSSGVNSSWIAPRGCAAHCCVSCDTSVALWRPRTNTAGELSWSAPRDASMSKLDGELCYAHDHLGRR